MTNFLLTGGAGFLGRHLTRDLLERYSGSRVKILDVTKSTVHLPSYMLNGSVDLDLGKNVCSSQDVKEALRGIDVVFHLAGIISFQRKDREVLEKVHVSGTRTVVNACLDAKIGRVVHISSVAALGYADDKAHPVDEEFCFDWEEAEQWKKYYMLTKHGGDLEVQQAVRNGLDCVIARPGLMWGPMGELNSLEFVKAVNEGRIPLNMPGGTAVVDVRDVSRGLVEMVDRGKTGESYLLSGRNLSFKEVNQTVAEVLGVKAPKFTLPRLLCDPLAFLVGMYEDLTGKGVKLAADNIHSAARFRYFDSSKAERDLGWSPKYSFRQTIEDVVKWAKEEKYL